MPPFFDLAFSKTFVVRKSDLCALEVVRRSRHKFGLIGVIRLTHQGQCTATLYLG